MCTYKTKCKVLQRLLCLALLVIALPNWAAEVSDADENVELSARLTSIELADQRAQFERAIVDIERQGGAYDQRLVESLMGAGRFSLEQGQYSEAANLFERALSVSRISGGLLNAEQPQILTLLVEALIGAGDWSNADDKAHLALYLQKRLLDHNSENYALAVVEYGEWKLAAVNNSAIKLNDFEELLGLEVLHAELLSDYPDVSQTLKGSAPLLALQAKQWSPKTRAELLNQIALMRYSFVRVLTNAMRGGRLRFSEPQYVYQNVCRVVTMGDGSRSQVCSRERVINPSYWEQQSERANLRYRMQSDIREFSDALAALRIVEHEESTLNLDNGLTLAEQIDQLGSMQTELEKSINFIRFW
jgi:tetratricopeptide (TPR) repeat protein